MRGEIVGELRANQAVSACMLRFEGGWDDMVVQERFDCCWLLVDTFRYRGYRWTMSVALI